ncbi:hypothetical protein ASF61_00935 [Duganella sp. Leaf126]|uniref:hypothetical protein n=1 Tax=Duganella sp. Leaf126 TaxID=1736266 RepID=UPI0006FFB654|nr:hypothetical protein [Duganella sp. Leaf126]KQQ47250.1 hypothetical protein ASF61_00935 [Duganella sp. Leaf126]
MRKTDLAKADAKKIMSKVSPGHASSFGKAPEVIDKREQRRRDQALGLVPFAVKLHCDLVAQLNAQATARGLDMNQLVGELLSRCPT